MSIRTLLLLIVGAAIALLAALNWSSLAAIQAISLGFTVVQGPLGLILIGLTLLLAAVFLVYIFYLHSTVMFETRRHTKELQNQRELADRAEASRFTELRTFLDGMRQDGKIRHDAGKQELLVRIAALETALAARLDQTDNTNAAFFGELGDRVDRRAADVPVAPVASQPFEPSPSSQPLRSEPPLDVTATPVPPFSPAQPVDPVPHPDRAPGRPGPDTPRW